MADQLTYKDARAGLKGTVLVYLGKRRIGTILKLKDGYQYRPMKTGLRNCGDIYPTLTACQQSLAS